jgi:hypothetical protein
MSIISSFPNFISNNINNRSKNNNNNNNDFQVLL